MNDQPPATSENPAPPLPPRMARRLDSPQPRNRNLIVYGAIAALVVAGLLLPPISLAERLFPGCGEVALDAQNASVQSSGVTLERTGADQSYRLTLKTVATADFQSGTAGDALAPARNNLPVNLVVSSPVYQIRVCGEKAQPGVIRVAVPAETAPQSTLDLYAWNAKTGTWAWIGSDLNAANATMSAVVEALPDAVALMQTTSVAPAIGAEVNPGESLDADIAKAMTEVYPTGLVIGPDGSLGGDRSALPSSPNPAQAVYPVIRNYLAGGQPNPDLVRGVLSVPEARQAHIAALVDLAAPYAGVTLDYQGLAAEDRDAYTTFISDLSAALKAQGKRLNVVLPMPTILASGETDTAGYDWHRIGLLADTVQAPMNSEALIAWATTLINRYKFQPVFSLAGTDISNGAVSSLSFRQAIDILGKVSTTQSASVPANSTVTFTLQSDVAISTFALDTAANVYRYEYTDRSGARHTVTINTAAALANELSVSLPHYVRGVVIRGAAGEVIPSVANVLRAYRQQAIATVKPEMMIAWQVKSGGNVVTSIEKSLTESWFGWTPIQTGTFSVSASIAGVERGAVDVTVVASAPAEEVKTVVAGVGGGSGGTTGDATPGGAAAGACYDAAYVADVTVPDGTHFDKGKDLTKTWKVRNNGTCAWSADTELAFVSGSQLSAPSTATAGVLEPGQEIEISVPMKSGDKDGNFTGVWQLRNKDGFYGETLTVVIRAGEQVAAATAPTAPGAPVAPIGNIGSFEAGAHVFGFGRPDLMKYAGMTWAKIQIRGIGDMSGTIADAHAKGFKVLLGVLGDRDQVMDPAYQDQYAAGVAAMAAAGADAIEVWNEPNIQNEWPIGQINGADYAALLAKAYRAIKAANPNTLVVSAALAPTGWWGAAGCGADGCNDDVFLSQMAAAGAANYMDCIGVHHNAGATSPSATTGHPADDGNHHYSWYFWPTLNLYYNSFGGARKVCFTELGYLSGEGYPDLASTAPGFAWARNTTVAQQAQWLAEAVSMSANSGKVRLVIVWNVDNTTYGSDPQAGYAIIRPDGSCPACDALRGVLGGR